MKFVLDDLSPKSYYTAYRVQFDYISSSTES